MAKIAATVLCSILMSGFYCMLRAPNIDAAVVSNTTEIIATLRHSFAGKVERLAVDGAVAVVYGTFSIEGSHDPDEFLLQRFPFGWQIVDVSVGNALDSCQFRSRGFSSESEKRLQQQVGKKANPGDPGCKDANQWSRDIGPVPDVIAIRTLEHNNKWTKIIPRVHVVGNYGLADWYGAGGGEHIYRRDGFRWTFISGGGGAHSVQELADLHMPISTACALTPPSDPWSAPCTKPTPAPGMSLDAYAVRVALSHDLGSDHAPVIAVDGDSAVALIPDSYSQYLCGNHCSTREFLLQKFSLGWQTVDLARDEGAISSCVFRTHDIPIESERRLQKDVGLPVRPSSMAACEDQFWGGDKGPNADVAAVRSLLRRKNAWITPAVRVSGDYALAHEINAIGLPIFHQENFQWKRDNDAYVSSDFTLANGIPPEIFCQLIPSYVSSPLCSNAQKKP